MSLIKDTWRQIVQRRLWPIALVLLAALVAVPVLLARNPAPAPAPAPGAPTAAAGTPKTVDEAMAKPAVVLATGSDSGRHVLGDRKDPFRPEATPTPTPTPTSTSTSTSTSGNGGGNSGGSGGSTAPTSPTPAPATPTPGDPTGAGKKPRTYPGDSLTVRFGTGEGDAKSVLEVRQALPDAAADDSVTPMLVYLGLTKDGKQARFLLDAGVNADGDGRCVSGGGTACETLYLRAGETEFLDVTGDDGTVTAKFQLDVLAIHLSAKSAKAAKAARARKSATAAASAQLSRAGQATTGPAALGLAGIARLLGSL
jgi:hypothetical protein